MDVIQLKSNPTTQLFILQELACTSNKFMQKRRSSKYCQEKSIKLSKYTRLRFLMCLKSSDFLIWKIIRQVKNGHVVPNIGFIMIFYIWSSICSLLWISALFPPCDAQFSTHCNHTSNRAMSGIVLVPCRTTLILIKFLKVKQNDDAILLPHNAITKGFRTCLYSM